MFDIDGTLRDECYGITTLTKTAIAKCKQRGVLVGVCTGRTLSTIHDEVLEMKFDILISGDGSQILLPNRILQDLFLSKDKVQQILDTLTNDVGYTVETKHQVYMNKLASEILLKSNKEKGITDLLQEKIIYEDTIHNFDIHTMPVSKICIWSSKSLAKYKDVYYVQCLEEDTKYYEIIHQEAGKGKAITTLLQSLNINKEEVLCFGDGINDISMFQACGQSVAMDNAVESLKRLATSVCPSVKEDGIYYELINRKIIEEN